MAGLLTTEDLERLELELRDALGGKLPDDVSLSPVLEERARAALAIFKAVRVLSKRVGLHVAELHIERQRAQRAQQSADELIADLDARLARLETKA